jgi:predicted metal-dependent hydrolase
MTHAVDKSGDWKNRLYNLGFELFNKGERFEAHEEWEAIWLDEPKGHPNRLFLQGLIQVAAAFHRVDTNFLGAAYRLFRSARRKLIPYSPTYKGVDVATLIPLLETWIERLGALNKGDAPSHADYFKMGMRGKGWHEPTREPDSSPAGLSTFKAFEQYSSDREVRSTCPKCGEALAVNGRRKAPSEEVESAWRVACPKGCVERAFAGARA